MADRTYFPEQQQPSWFDNAMNTVVGGQLRQQQQAQLDKDNQQKMLMAVLPTMMANNMVQPGQAGTPGSFNFAGMNLQQTPQFDYGAQYGTPGARNMSDVNTAYKANNEAQGDTAGYAKVYSDIMNNLQYANKPELRNAAIEKAQKDFFTGKPIIGKTITEPSNTVKMGGMTYAAPIPSTSSWSGVKAPAAAPSKGKITPAKVNEYKKKFKGDAKKAREAAIKDGWSV